MIKVPGKIRTYRVTKDDFPIKSEVKAIALDFCQVVISDIHVSKDGEEKDSIPVSLSENPADQSASFTIPPPIPDTELNLLVGIDCWFSKNPPDRSRYKVTITSNTGDTAKTYGFPPSINPRTILLKFYYS